MSTVQPRIAVVVFPGSNDDRDAAGALGALGADPVLVWHGDHELPPGTGAVVLPGGFSYGDYLRSGAIASLAPAMDAVRRFAEAGGPVLGICNGFQILCEAGLLPGVLRPNRNLEFVCRDVAVRVERTDTLFTRRCDEGANPTGAVGDVAGVCNAEGNVVGLMPHPEHAVDPLLGSGDGALLLAGLVDAASEWMLAVGSP